MKPLYQQSAVTELTQNTEFIHEKIAQLPQRVMNVKHLKQSNLIHVHLQPLLKLENLFLYKCQSWFHHPCQVTVAASPPVSHLLQFLGNDAPPCVQPLARSS